jgi:hypothetical protein
VTSETLHIFIGYDEVESVAFDVLCHSITSRASMPVAFHPVKLSMLRDVYNRPRDPKQSNEFSFTRFLVPYLMNYQGWALFMDLDMLVRTDIRELWELRRYDKAVMVCQHDYQPSTQFKYLGNIQYTYPRKNWSSVMLFNCGHEDCQTLTPDYVNSAPALDLHRLLWAEEDNIGGLPLEWNWLVGEYLHNPDAKNVHFTIGGPWFTEFGHVDYADEWFKEKSNMLYTEQVDDKGKSA